MLRAHSVCYACVIGCSLLTAEATLAAPVVGQSFFVADPGTSGGVDLALVRGPSGYAVAWVALGTAAARPLDDGAAFLQAPTPLQVT